MRIKEEKFIGYGFRVDRKTVQAMGGQSPLFNGDGSPKQVEITELVFVDQETMHSFMVPFEPQPAQQLRLELLKGISEAEKQEIIRELTGIMVPTPQANGA